MNQAFQIPGVGPTFDGSNGGMQYSGMMPQQQQPAQPAAPTDFMQLIGQQAAPAQGGNNAGGNADANAVLALFGQMLSGGAQGTQVSPVAAPAAAPSALAAPAPAPAAWEALLKDFSVNVDEPDFIKDPSKLGAFFDASLNQIDFAAGLSSEDPNKFMRATMNSLMTQAVQSAFLASKQITSGTIPQAFNEYAKRTWKNEQMGAVNKVEAVPQSMGFIASALAEKFTAAQPNATPAQVQQAVSLLMENMKKAFQPAVQSNSPAPETDWFNFMKG